MKWYSRIAAFLVLPLLSGCAKEVENMNVITTPVGGTITFKVTAKYVHIPIESVSFTSKKLGAYRNSYGGYTIFLEQVEAGQTKAQVKLSFAGGATFSSLNRSQVVLMPGKSGSQVAYNQIEGYSSLVSNLVIGEVGKKVTGTFKYNSPKANPIDQTDVYTIEGTFECNRLPDSE